MKHILIGAIVIAGLTFFVTAQGAGPSLNDLSAGASVVSGKAAPGSTPISVYDLSFEQKTKIGQANAAQDDGSFSTAVRPPLTQGHQIVAVDRNGNAGSPMTVK